MIKVCKEYVDPLTHQVITVLVDSFGRKFMVQTPILEADHAPAVEQATSDMAAREAAFITALKEKHAHTDEMIAKLQQDGTKDCGCGQ